MVSAGDTVISLHIRPGTISNLVLGGGVYSGEVKTQNTLSAKICLIFNFQRGWGYSGEVKTQNTLSAKICLIFNWECILEKSKLKIL